MKRIRLAAYSIALLSILSLPVAHAAMGEEHNHDHASHQQAASANAERGAYPLDTCVVSGEKLGEMGEPYEYVYREEGKPDRLVLFCCKGCLKDFKKDPPKYLRKLDEAAAEKAELKR